MSEKNITLFTALSRSHFNTMVLSACMAGILLAYIAFVTLRTSIHDNFELIARSIAYNSEAAVVFGDKETAEEIVKQIAERERLTEVQILVPNGDVFARYSSDANETMIRFGETLGKMIFPDMIRADIVFDQHPIGTIALRGDSMVFVSFFFKTLLTILASLLLIALVSRYIAKRTERRIVDRIDAFAALARSLRLDKGFGRRLPSFGIVEFDELGKDFNALLAETEASRVELMSRQEELEEANASLSHLALHDGLTGLANRVHFNDRLTRAIKYAQIRNEHIGVLYLDNDRFKQINDSFGHASGDTLLVSVSQRIRQAIRDTDFVARVGGDEFAVLLAPLRDSQIAELVANKILSVMSDPVIIGDGIVANPTISIGIALFPEHGNNCDDLLRAADAAMYLAKNEGRAGYHVFDPEGTVSAKPCQINN